MKKLLLLILLVFFPFEFFSQELKGNFSTEIKKQVSYGYILHKPEKVKSKKPLIIFLHGSGEKGTDLEKVKSHGPLKYIQNNSIDAFILAPQCPENEYWESESLHQLIQKIVKENQIDTNRIYLTGLSMGAWGAWNLAFAHPETFAALVPICGFVDRVPMIENCKIANIPTRIFHGLVDDVVDVNYSITIYKKLKGCSKDLELTIFDDANHDSWTRVYNNAAIYEWMFQQIKK
ncbi:MAG TPA: prolyl oligopeptidase family serine peptidase [Flavobacterium sp.]|uniref:carboxylesterase family protein n=1 Tax=unclassified Flavobacterium TaxID=196869 RepID=UPI000E8FB196|nr:MULTISPECIES: prolyl oligopeptidase family serine peptidase [unclassified Flavobacterium]HBI00382.1 phospholipase [Flavobacterium sp.]HRE76758.1 prolyl oligopeptidase family serine peptidase [Flavobacterium sp.]